MTFSTFALAILVVFPMIAGFGVLLLAKKKFGNFAGLAMGVGTLVVTGWFVLNYGMLT